MKCLVVTAHPLAESLCQQFARQVIAQLKDMGHEISTEDLYGQGFDPALTVDERASYYSGSYHISDITEQLERLCEAEGLVLLFPTWWFGFPAILKGWFDRVWAPGFAYDHASDFGPIKPRLDRLRRVLVITTLGSPWWVDRLLLRQPVRRVIKHALLGTCAKRSKLTYLCLYKSENLNTVRIEQFSDTIRCALQGWR
ncbi:MAG: NAD(P)H-dependent oxidoreductase [Candidatus Thiodiazotropha endolucinida]